MKSIIIQKYNNKINTIIITNIQKVNNNKDNKSNKNNKNNSKKTKNIIIIKNKMYYYKMIVIQKIIDKNQGTKVQYICLEFHHI